MHSDDDEESSVGSDRGGDSGAEEILSLDGDAAKTDAVEDGIVPPGR